MWRVKWELDSNSAGKLPDCSNNSEIHFRTEVQMEQYIIHFPLFCISFLFFHCAASLLVHFWCTFLVQQRFFCFYLLSFSLILPGSFFPPAFSSFLPLIFYLLSPVSLLSPMPLSTSSVLVTVWVKKHTLDSSLTTLVLKCNSSDFSSQQHFIGMMLEQQHRQGRELDSHIYNG